MNSINRLKILFIIVVAFLMFIPSIYSLQQKVVKFIKVTSTNNFPKIYEKIDSLFVDYYKWSEYDKGNYAYKLKHTKMPDNLLLSFAKTFVWMNYLPKQYEREYFDIASIPSREQYKREMEAIKNGVPFNELKLPPPKGVKGKIKDRIFKEMTWEWRFHIQNKYILVLEPITKNVEPIEEEDSPKSIYYNCKVLDDIKGNFSGGENILLSVNFVKGSMNIGNQYMVLIYGKNTVTKYHGEHFLVRGLATNNEAIFPIVEGRIIDENNVLRTYSREIDGESFRNSIRYFLHNIVGVRNEI